MSLHRLLNKGDRIKWNILSPLAAAVAFLKIVTQWWSWYSAGKLARSLTFEMFVGVIVGAVLLFLLAATSLPDVTEAEDVLDMSNYYRKTQRRFWLLFAAHWTVVNGVSLWAQMQIEGAHLSLASPVFLIGPAAVVMAFVRVRWLHAACFIGLIFLYLTQFHGQHLIQS